MHKGKGNSAQKTILWTELLVSVIPVSIERNNLILIL